MKLTYLAEVLVKHDCTFGCAYRIESHGNLGTPPPSPSCRLHTATNTPTKKNLPLEYFFDYFHVSLNFLSFVITHRLLGLNLRRLTLNQQRGWVLFRVYCGADFHADVWLLDALNMAGQDLLWGLGVEGLGRVDYVAKVLSRKQTTMKGVLGWEWLHFC